MNGWIALGKRYINLDNVGEVLFDDHRMIARVVLVGGGMIELRDDDARDLQSLLSRTTTTVVEPHRTVFAMPDL